MPSFWKAKQPYNVNVAATVAGLASLAHAAEIQRTVDTLIAERERLYRGVGDGTVPASLSQPGELRALPRGGPGRAGAEGALAREGILVRHYAKPGLENCIRISAGRPEQTDVLLAALARVG